MILQFNADEIFAMAQQLELNANAFYKRAASMATSAGTAALLEELAKWELTHFDAFAELRKQLGSEMKEEMVFDPEHETGLYLKAIADGHVFDMRKDVKDILKGGESMEEILKIALKMEKDSIIFYLGLKEMVPEGSGRTRVNHIIHEEMRHISFINRELTTLK